MKTTGTSKEPLSILMKPETRKRLSDLYEGQYRYRYHSFSIFVEEMLLIALNEVGA